MAKHLYIEGMVQGVGYRAAFAAQAQALGISGWVRNRADGAVEATVDGEEQTLDQLIQWARRGPPAARVIEISITEVSNAHSSVGRMEIRPTE